MAGPREARESAFFPRWTLVKKALSRVSLGDGLRPQPRPRPWGRSRRRPAPRPGSAPPASQVFAVARLQGLRCRSILRAPPQTYEHKLLLLIV